ncbi:hypothetical protein D9M68_732600 [compost metagenome]
MLQHHGEQVLAFKALHHLARLGRHRDRVAVVDDQRFDLRAESGRAVAQQIVADGDHVEGARLAAGQEVGPVQCGALDGEMPRGRQQQAAGAVAPGAHQRRQAGDGTHRVAAAAHALHAVVQADGGRLGGAVCARQIGDLLHRDAAHLCRALGGPLQRALAKTLPAQRVLRYVVVVQPVVRDELVHERECQRRVGARAQGDVFVALLSRL